MCWSAGLPLAHRTQAAISSSKATVNCVPSGTSLSPVKKSPFEKRSKSPTTGFGAIASAYAWNGSQPVVAKVVLSVFSLIVSLLLIVLDSRSALG
jgi:hypothetical protein